MLTQFFQRLFNHTQATSALTASLPAQLMERAEASAGQDPHHAAELRRAAIAFLGIVR
ncbi:hypothetical protein [Ottowia sp.]|uniref:hypothetical protein n=1 Tax=Ottowia sp. TaxID=1898956 RepID=UPI003A873E29